MSQQMTAPSAKAKQLVANYELVARNLDTLGATELGDAETAVLDYIASLEAQVSAPRPMEGSETEFEARITALCKELADEGFDRQGGDQTVSDRILSDLLFAARAALLAQKYALRSSRENEREAKRHEATLDEAVAARCSAIDMKPSESPADVRVTFNIPFDVWHRGKAFHILGGPALLIDGSLGASEEKGR